MEEVDAAGFLFRGQSQPLPHPSEKLLDPAPALKRLLGAAVHLSCKVGPDSVSIASPLAMQHQTVERLSAHAAAFAPVWPQMPECDLARTRSTVFWNNTMWPFASSNSVDA